MKIAGFTIACLGFVGAMVMGVPWLGVMVMLLGLAFIGFGLGGKVR